MQKKLLLKLLSMALATVTVFSMVGCGSKDVTSSEKTSESTPVTSESKEESTESTEKVSEELSYPLDTDYVLSIYNNSNNLNSNYTDYKDVPLVRGLEEKTGVKTEWEYLLVGNDGAQTLNLLLTEEELPDILIAWVPEQADQLIEDGVLVDLTELIPQYAPDYWELISSDPSLLARVQSAEGRLYGFHSILEGDFNLTFTGPVIRQDWLDECGLEAPVTMEDWENVLVTFKDKYGAKMGFAKNRFKNNGIGSGTGAFGNLGANYFIDDNGKVQLSQVQPEWKEYMEYLNRWYDMGLIDPDAFTMDDTALRAKVANNEVGIAFTAMSQLTNWAADAEATNTGAKWVGFSYPRTASGATTCMIQTNSRVPGQAACITTSCPEEEIITALRWLNYGYTEEGMLLYNYGIEGESYELDADGNPEWLESAITKAGDLATLVTMYSDTASVVGTTVQMSSLVASKNNQVSVDAVGVWTENTEAQKHFLTGTTLTADEKTAYSDMFTGIQATVEEMATKFIIGEVSLDKFDDFVKDLYDKKLQECIDIQQAAYDRLMNK